MSTISEHLRDLQTLPTERLVARYAELVGKQPRVRNVAWLRRQIAWKLQERELGGLSDRAKARLEELVAQVDLPLREQPLPRPRPQPTRSEAHTPSIGTTLVRRWRDQDIRVEVRDDGVEWNGVLYTSLSAAAKAITGSAWNGRLFFGLTKRRAAR